MTAGDHTDHTVTIPITTMTMMTIQITMQTISLRPMVQQPNLKVMKGLKRIWKEVEPFHCHLFLHPGLRTLCHRSKSGLQSVRLPLSHCPNRKITISHRHMGLQGGIHPRCNQSLWNCTLARCGMPNTFAHSRRMGSSFNLYFPNGKKPTY